MHSSAANWPTLTPRVRELFRRGAEIGLTRSEDDFEELHQATMAGLHVRNGLDDPTLIHAIKRVNLDNMRRWAASNLSDPGARVPCQLSAEAISLTRDIVRRGFDGRSLDCYRTSQSMAWRIWMDICFTLTSDVTDLKELLDVSALSISTFHDDILDAILKRIEADLGDLTRGSNAERLATLALILEGAPITEAHAEHRLRYRLAGDHTAVVIWSGAPDTRATIGAEAGNAAADLETVADTLVRLNGCTHRLTLVASARSLWVWLPTAGLRTGEPLTTCLAASPDIRVTIGRSGRGLDGFRRSHLDATATQRMLARVTASRRVARYEDVQLVTLLTSDLARANDFVTDTLGAFANAEPEIRETVLVYIREQFNASRTAEILHAHRNTVLRRLERADQLLPRPLADNITNIAAALELLQLRPTPNP